MVKNISTVYLMLECPMSTCYHPWHTSNSYELQYTTEKKYFRVNFTVLKVEILVKELFVSEHCQLIKWRGDEVTDCQIFARTRLRARIHTHTHTHTIKGHTNS